MTYGTSRQHLMVFSDKRSHFALRTALTPHAYLYR